VAAVGRGEGEQGQLCMIWHAHTHTHLCLLWLLGRGNRQGSVARSPCRSLKGGGPGGAPAGRHGAYKVMVLHRGWAKVY